jgi:PAS domain S-box-containing protein
MEYNRNRSQGPAMQHEVGCGVDVLPGLVWTALPDKQIDPSSALSLTESVNRRGSDPMTNEDCRGGVALTSCEQHETPDIDIESAEEQLGFAAAQVRQIIDTVPSFLWSADPTGEPTHINQRALDYSGMRFEDFKHGGWEAFVHPDDFPETIRAFSHAIRTGTSYETVHRLRDANGEFRWYHARGEPVRDQQGCIIQWYGLTVDIDEAKKAEDRLRRSEANLAEAQRLSHTGSWAVNPTTRKILYWSEECYRIWGFDPAQGLPYRAGMFQRIHPDDRSRVLDEAQEALRQKRDYSIDFRIILPDGTIKYLETIGHHLFSEQGELVEVIGTNIDVTERKRAEQALQDSEAKFRDYAETASDWFCEIGPDYKYTMLSEKAFGSGAADRIGTACWDHALDLETEPEKWRLLQETVFAHKPFRDFVFLSLSGNGSPMYVRASGRPMFDANGEFRGYRGACTDVTAITRAERAEASLRAVQAELAHVSRVTTLGQLTASIAHEITQPIGGAVVSAQAALRWLARQPPDVGKATEAINNVVSAGKRAADIVTRTRALVSKVPTRKEDFEINQAISDVIALTRAEVLESGVQLQTELAANLPVIHGDRIQLQQVMLNLIMNAVEAMSQIGDDRRELLVTTRMEADCVLVAVRDSGPGLTEAAMERAFEPFYTTKSSGLGMGLSICRSIVEAHEGRLWATANVPTGAAFQFTVPIHSAPQGVTAA